MHGHRSTFQFIATAGKRAGLISFSDLSGGVRIRTTNTSSFLIDRTTGNATLKGTALNLVTDRRVSFTIVVDTGRSSNLSVRIGSYRASGRLPGGSVYLIA